MSSLRDDRKLPVFIHIAEVMQTPVKMDDIPLCVPQPNVEFVESQPGGAAVFVGTMNLRDVTEEIFDQRRVSLGDGVSNQ